MPAGGIEPARASKTSKTLEKYWKQLSSAVIQIQHHQEGNLSFEETYRCCYHLVTNKKPDLVYNGVTDLVRRRVCVLRSAIEKSNETATFLETLLSSFEEHALAMTMIRDILLFLDKHYCKKQGFDPIYEVGMSIFQQEILDATNVSSKTQDYTLQFIARERAGESMDRVVLKKISTMLSSFSAAVDGRNPYQKIIEAPLLEQSEKFYKQKQQSMIDVLSCGEYVKTVDDIIQNESDRITTCLASCTLGPILELIKRHLIENCLEDLFAMPSGPTFMLDNDKKEDLHRLYNRCVTVSTGRDRLATCVQEYFESVPLNCDVEGDKIKSAIAFVNAVLALKQRADAILVHCFVSKDQRDQPDHQLRAKINLAFEHIVNRVKKNSEYMSIFFDNLLRKRIKEMSEDELEETVSRAVDMFRFIEDKDVFERLYCQHLAKRLLNSKVVSDDAEHLVMSKLKTECGSNFTQKMIGMFKDIQLSQKAMEEYKLGQESDTDDDSLNIACPVNVKVLTPNFWVLPQVTKVVWPASMQSAIQKYENFYSSRHQGRNLQWHHLLGTVDLTAEYQHGKKIKTHILTAPTHFAILLLQFNQGHDLSFRTLLERTQLERQDATRALQSLALGKARILCKSSSGKSIDDDDIFTVNDTFTSKMTKIRLQQIASRSSKDEESQEEKDVKKRIDEERKLVIDACVVRIMKARRTLPFSRLVNEVTTQLSSRFKPNPQMIKKRLESLIDREFLARDAENRSICNYLA